LILHDEQHDAPLALGLALTMKNCLAFGSLGLRMRDGGDIPLAM
jgi:hypothetical protein